MGCGATEAFCQRTGTIIFPLLADFETQGCRGAIYGAYRNQEGVAQRALFVLDKNGIIAWSYLSPVAVQSRCGWDPGSAGSFAEVRPQSGELYDHTQNYRFAPRITSRVTSTQPSRLSSTETTSARIVGARILSSNDCRSTLESNSVSSSGIFP